MTERARLLTLFSLKDEFFFRMRFVPSMDMDMVPI